MNATVGNY